MIGWQLVAYGTPAPQGSKRYMGRGKNGKGILVESSAAVKPWREDVKQAGLALIADGAPRLDGPIAVRMVFTVARPKSAPKRRQHPDTTPDLSKLCRATEDAITTAGLWSDDARVVDYRRLGKVWPGFDAEALPVPGVIVLAAQLDCPEASWALNFDCGRMVAAGATFGLAKP